MGGGRVQVVGDLGVGLGLGAAGQDQPGQGPAGEGNRVALPGPPDEVGEVGLGRLRVARLERQQGAAEPRRPIVGVIGHEPVVAGTRLRDLPRRGIEQGSVQPRGPAGPVVGVGCDQGVVVGPRAGEVAAPLADVAQGKLGQPQLPPAVKPLELLL